MPETKLKACPFCGEEPHIGEDADGWAVLCKSMHCDPSPTTCYRESEADAIAAWNFRTPDPLAQQMADAIEALKPLMHDSSASGETPFEIAVENLWSAHKAWKEANQ